MEPLTLSADKRNRLLAAFKTVPLPAKTRKPRLVIPWREAASVAAMLAMLAGIATVVMNNSVLPDDRLEDSVAFLFGSEAKYKQPGAVTPLAVTLSTGIRLPRDWRIPFTLSDGVEPMISKYCPCVTSVVDM